MNDRFANDPQLPLVEAFGRRRDEASFRRLYQAFTPTLFGFALRISRDRAEAEELVQETWSRAVARHHTYERGARYGTWLMGILLNCHREAVRRAARYLSAADDERLDAAAPTAGSAASSSPAEVDLQRALGVLPPGYLEIVLLHDVNGHTHQEIAGMLGISEGTSKSQLARGRALLRTLLVEGPRAARSDHSAAREVPDER